MANNYRQQQYSDSYYWTNSDGSTMQVEGEVIPPGEDDRNYHRDDRGKDRDRDRNYDRDRERKRRSRSRSRSHERRRRRDKKKRERSSGSGSSRSRSRSRDQRRRSRSRSRDRNRRDRDKPTHDHSEYRERECERTDSWRMIAPNNTIMVNSLPLHATENEIRSDILVYGLVPKDIRLIRRKDTGASRGFAFVEFSTLPEAVRWMEAKQGVLVLDDHFQATLQYSNSKDSTSDKAAKAAQDWFCINCGEHNFKRREICFKCQSPRCESELVNDVQKEVSVYPTSTVLLRNLDVLTTEERILNALQTVAGVGSLPIKSVRIGRDPLNNISRGVCYLDMNNTGDAMRLFAGLSDAGVLNIDGREVLVSYCKLASSALTAATVAALSVKTSTPAAATAVAAAQWSVSSGSNSTKVVQAASGGAVDVHFSQEEIPRMAEYSASIYAKTPEEHAYYLQYYTQYYTTQLQSSMVPTATAPDLSKYVFDDKSGYYYDSAANLYYDSNTQYFYNPLSLQFSYWDNEKHTFVPVQQNAGETAKSGVPIPDKDEKKEKPEKQDKVTVAKKIAKDMEKWAKTLNQRKESTKVAVQPPTAEPSSPNEQEQLSRRRDSAAGGDMEKSSLNEVLQVLQRKQMADSKKSSAIVAAYGSDSDSDTTAASEKRADLEALIDWNKLACLLCKRQFANKETLVKHQQLSDLHKQNLDVWKKQNIPSAPYRDRAKERRAKFGDTESPGGAQRKKDSSFTKSSRMQDSEAEASSYERTSSNSAASFAGSSNVGSKLLQKMGWSQGQGLGKSNQGRTTIIEAERRSATAGLGMKTYAVAGDDYRQSVKKLAMMRFKELNEDEMH